MILLNIIINIFAYTFQRYNTSRQSPVHYLKIDVKEAVEDLQPGEEHKNEVLEEARNHLQPINFRHNDLHTLHSYIQCISKLVATPYEKGCNSDFVLQVSMFHCIIKMLKNIPSAYFKKLKKEKQFHCKAILHD
uniref:Uncharacterized protein n=1 Tax=Strongyloides venezuelensis TaxID=75913 RepID=A0A0K0FR99_STRVS